MPGPTIKGISTVTVTTAGTRVQVTSSTIMVESVTIQGHETNTGYIYIGASDVASTKGLVVSAKESVTITGEQIRGTTETFDLSDVWIDSSVNGEKARVIYQSRR